MNVKEFLKDSPVFLYFFFLLAAGLMGIFVGSFSITMVILPVAFILVLMYIWAFLRYPKQSLLFFMLFVLLQWLIVEKLGGKSTYLGLFVTYSDEGVILLTFLLMILGLALKRKSFHSCKLGVPLLVITIIGTVGSISAGVPIVIGGSALIILLKGFLLFYIFAHLSFKEQDTRQYLKILGIVAGVILFLGLVDFLDPIWFQKTIGNVGGVDWRFGILSIKSIFTHPGIFGWFCAFVALFNLALYFTTKKKRFFFLFIAFVFGVVFSMRRRPMAGVVVAALIGMQALPLQRRVKTTLALGALAVFLGFLFAPQISGLIRHTFQIYIFSPNPTEVARNSLYLTSTEIAKDYFPLGTGLGRYGGDIAARYYSPIYVKYGLNQVYGLGPNGHFLDDTFWPMILGELGIIGFFFYIWICLRLLVFAWQAQKKLDSPLEKAFALGAFMVFIEGLVESLADPVFVKPPEAYFLFGAMGVLYSIMLGYKKRNFTNENSISQ